MIKWDLNFTTTKLLSYLIFLAGIIVSLVLKSPQVFLESIITAGALQGVKSVGESLIARQKAKTNAGE